MSYSRQIRRAAARRAAKEQARKAAKEQARKEQGSNALAGGLPVELPPRVPRLDNLRDDLPAIEDMTPADTERFLAEQEVAMRSSPEPVPSPARNGASIKAPTAASIKSPRPASTGPRTIAGKAKSSMNNFRHGLTGKFLVLDHESQADFDVLSTALLEEHQPATATEQILVTRMAEHVWLSRRAQNLQDAAILANSPANLALFMRYQTTNDRAFHKCLAGISAIRRERRRQAAEFESQNRERERHEVSPRTANARLARQESPVAASKPTVPHFTEPEKPVSNEPGLAAVPGKHDQAAA